MSTVPKAAKKGSLVGGKLKLKGSGSSSGSRPKVLLSADASMSANSSAVKPVEEFLTEAQRRHKQRKMELESRDIKKLTEVSYRDRVENFNAKLSKMTEHNDIPRISAAGNG
jgi:protein FAM32A